MSSTSETMNGRVALVPGGKSGIGRAIAQELVGLGASVALVDLDGSAADAAAGEMSGAIGFPQRGVGSQRLRVDRSRRAP